MTIRLARRGTMAGRGIAPGGVTDFVQLRRTSNQAISAAPIEISFNAEDSDVSNYWSSGAASRITVPTGKTGDHLMTLTWSFDGGTDRSFGDFQVYNSSDVLQRTHRSPGGFNGEDTGHNTTMTRLNAGEYVKISVYQPRNGNLTAARFEMVRIA